MPIRRDAGGYVYTELRTNVAGASKLPDVAFDRRRPPESERKHALSVAEVAIEILSPQDRVAEQRAKREWYVQQGAQVAVLLDPARRTATRFDAMGPSEMIPQAGTLALLPGLALALTDVFAVLSL